MWTFLWLWHLAQGNLGHALKVFLHPRCFLNFCPLAFSPYAHTAAEPTVVVPGTIEWKTLPLLKTSSHLRVNLTSELCYQLFTRQSFACFHHWTEGLFSSFCLVCFMPGLDCWGWYPIRASTIAIPLSTMLAHQLAAHCVVPVWGLTPTWFDPDVFKPRGHWKVTITNDLHV